MSKQDCPTRTVAYVCPLIPSQTAILLCLSLEKKFPVKFLKFESMAELFQLLSDPLKVVDFVAIDLEYFYSIPIADPTEILSTLRTLIKCRSRRVGAKLCQNTVKLMGVVGSDTEISLIEKAVNDFDRITLRIDDNITVDEITNDVDLFLSGNTELPNIVKDRLESARQPSIIDSRPVHLFFNRLLEKGYLKDIKPQLDSLEHKVVACQSWRELPEKLKLSPKSVCFHANELNFSSATEIVSMVRTMARLEGLYEDITVTVGVDYDTTYQTVQELKKSEIFGIVPAYSAFGWEETVKSLRSQWNLIPYWPKTVIRLLPGYYSHAKIKVKNGIDLTVRQQQIFELAAKQGLSNKLIAKSLNIGESTVKMHMSQILKKHAVRSRTQLASFFKDR